MFFVSVLSCGVLSSPLSYCLEVGLTCTLILFDLSTVFVKAVKITSIVTFVWAPVLLARYTVLVGPSHLLGLLRNARVHQFHLALSLRSFCLASTGGLYVEFCIVLNVL